MLIGTLVGSGVGFTSVATYDVAHHENYHWLTGGFGGAVFGFLGSCAILAGVGVVDLFHHHDTLVYEDQRTGKTWQTDLGRSSQMRLSCGVPQHAGDDQPDKRSEVPK